MWTQAVIERGDSSSYGNNIICNKCECSRGNVTAAGGCADEHLYSADRPPQDARGFVSTRCLSLPFIPLLCCRGGWKGLAGTRGGKVHVVSRRVSDDVPEERSKEVLAEPPLLLK